MSVKPLNSQHLTVSSENEAITEYASQLFDITSSSTFKNFKWNHPRHLHEYLSSPSYCNLSIGLCYRLLLTGLFRYCALLSLFQKWGPSSIIKYRIKSYWRIWCLTQNKHKYKYIYVCVYIYYLYAWDYG